MFLQQQPTASSEPTVPPLDPTIGSTAQRGPRSSGRAVELDASHAEEIACYLCGLTGEARVRRFHGSVVDDAIRSVCASLDRERYRAVAHRREGAIVALVELYPGGPADIEMVVSAASATIAASIGRELLDAGICLARKAGVARVVYFWHPGEAWAVAGFRAAGAVLDFDGRAATLTFGRTDVQLRPRAGIVA